MVQFRNIKGTHDLFPEELKTWQMIEKKIHEISPKRTNMSRNFRKFQAV